MKKRTGYTVLKCKCSLLLKWCSLEKIAVFTLVCFFYFFLSSRAHPCLRQLVFGPERSIGVQVIIHPTTRNRSQTIRNSPPRATWVKTFKSAFSSEGRRWIMMILFEKEKVQKARAKLFGSPAIRWPRTERAVKKEKKRKVLRRNQHSHSVKYIFH